VKHYRIVRPPTHLETLNLRANSLNVLRPLEDAARENEDGIVRIDLHHAVIAAFIREHQIIAACRHEHFRDARRAE
jgi:hypothetical protein